MSNVKHTQRKKQEEKKKKDCCKPLLSNVKQDDLFGGKKVRTYVSNLY